MENKNLILSTKFQRPRLQENILYRKNLVQILEENKNKTITLISAPAGYGKTTLVCQWLGKTTYKNIWLALDEDIDHLNTFFIYFIKGIDQEFPGFFKTIKEYINFNNLPKIDEIIPIVINEITNLKKDLVFVLDDYHLITNVFIHEFLDELIRYSPNTFHLIILSRFDPPLILNKMRAYELMNEMRVNDLIFDEDEISQLFRLMKRKDLDPENLETLTTLSEGWILGLKTIISVELDYKKTEKNIFAENRLVVNLSDYIEQSITRLLPNELYDKILNCTILDEFNDELIARLNVPAKKDIDNQYKSKDLFQLLIQKELFVFSIDDERNWYRFHPLFRELLHKKLLKEKTDTEIAQLHLAASEWFDQNGYFAQSIDHAILSNDEEHAVRLFTKFLYREMALENWAIIDKSLQKFQIETLYSSPFLLLAKAFYMEYLSDWQEGLNLVNRIQGLISEMKDDDPKKEVISAEVKALLSIAVVRNNLDYEQAISYAEEALMHLPQEATFIRFYALLGKSIGEIYSGIDSDFINTFKMYRSREISAIGKSKYNGAIGLLSILKADLGMVKTVATYGMKLLKRTNSEIANVAVYYHLFSQYYRNELEDYQAFIYLAHQKRHILRPFYYVQCVIIGSFTEMVHGYHKKAFEILDEAEMIILTRNSPDALNFIRVAKVELAIRQGDFNLSERLALDVDFSFRRPTWEFISPMITEFKLIVNRCNYEEAENKFQELITMGTSIHHMHFMVSLLTCRAGFFWMWKEKRKAIDALDEAIQISKPGHYIRPYLDLGSPMRELIGEYAKDYGSDHYVQALVDAFSNEPVPDKKMSFHLQHGTTSTRSGQTAIYKAGLTKRELEVIRAATKGFTNKEIAIELFLSELTVKKHMSHIFSKLNVKNRQSLIVKSKNLHLV